MNSNIFNDFSSMCQYPNFKSSKILLAMGTKNGANASFSVQRKIFPKLKAKILQIRYQNVQKGSKFTVEL